MHQSCEIIGIAISINKKTECEIYKVLSKLVDTSPVIDFGNSDCMSHCESHFLKLNF